MHDFVQHKHDCGGGHISVIPHYSSGETQLGIRHTEMFLNVVDHLASTGMNNPRANTRPGKSMPLQQLLERCFDHWTSQLLNRGPQHNSELPVAMLKSNLLDLLGIDERLKVDNSWIFEIDMLPVAQQEGSGAISANRVSDDRFKGVIDVIASGADLNG
jgi:hypothetical protein